MNKHWKYYLNWIWNFGTLPPQGYSDHWLLKRFGKKLKYVKIAEELMGKKGEYFIALNSPPFIPMSDTWRNGWFGIKRKIFKSK